MFNDEKIRGVICPIVTPMNDVGEMDLNSIDKLVDFLYTGGLRTLLVAGTTGEGMLLSTEERKKLSEKVIQTAQGFCTVIIHTGCASTAETIELTKHARDMGAHAVSIITPYFFSYTQDELFDHYIKISRQVPDLPIFLYCYPGNAKNNITPRLLEQLLKETKNIIGIKLSDVDLIQFQEYVEIGGENFYAFCGVDAIMLPALSVGSKGQISGNSNVFPEVFCDLYNAYLAGDWHNARIHQLKIAKIRSVLKDQIAYFKSALRIRNIDVGVTRSPIKWLDDSEYHQLINDIEQLDLL